MNIIPVAGIITTPTIDRTHEAMDSFFATYSVNMTSGLRPPLQQLEVILEKIGQHGIQKLYPELTSVHNQNPELKILVEDKLMYWWHRGWSKLLNIGEIINPPYAAEVLFDYFRPGSIVNKKGSVIPPSNHSTGHSFDIGGLNKDLNEIGRRVQLAIDSGQCFIHGMLIEKCNNAVHIDCEPIE